MSDQDALDVANAVHAQIEEIRPALPLGVHIEPFYDQSTIVHESIASVRDAVLLGLLLSSVILVLFLRDWGTSLVAGLVIGLWWPRTRDRTPVATDSSSASAMTGWTASCDPGGPQRRRRTSTAA